MQWACLSHEAFEEVRKRGSKIPVKLPRLLDVDPSEAARELRIRLGFDLLQPLPYLLLALERIGVTILGLPYCDDAIDAFCAWKGDEPVIAVLDGRPGDRIRYSVAHELGHLVLHGNGRMQTGGSSAGKEIETEADKFAAEILVPLDAIARVMPSKPTLNNLAMLKTQWGVSIKGLIRRARELGVIDQERAICLYKQISSRGWNRFEPGHVPIEKPRAFRKLVEIAYGKVINVDSFAADRGWSEELAHEILDRYASPSELPFDSRSIQPPHDVEDNIIQLSSRR
jgi:Zn-dependent peptidase ImmA (M78 family)